MFKNWNKNETKWRIITGILFFFYVYNGNSKVNHFHKNIKKGNNINDINSSFWRTKMNKKLICFYTVHKLCDICTVYWIYINNLCQIFIDPSFWYFYYEKRCLTLIRVIGFVMHHKTIFHEIETIRAGLEWICDHFVNWKMKKEIQIYLPHHIDYQLYQHSATN